MIKTVFIVLLGIDILLAVSILISIVYNIVLSKNPTDALSISKRLSFEIILLCQIGILLFLLPML